MLFWGGIKVVLDVWVVVCIIHVHHLALQPAGLIIADFAHTSFQVGGLSWKKNCVDIVK